MDEENNARVEEKPATAEQMLKELDRQRKELRTQVKDERTLRLEKAAVMREGRDERIEKIQIKLKKISEVIFAYNKLGKVAKVEFNVLEMITKALNAEEDIVADSVN